MIFAREERGIVNPLGLYDLDRNIRAVGQAYKQMIRDWCEILPAQSICLRVPVVPPHAHHEPMAERQRESARRIGETTPAEPSVAT